MKRRMRSKQRQKYANREEQCPSQYLIQTYRLEGNMSGLDIQNNTSLPESKRGIRNTKIKLECKVQAKDPFNNMIFVDDLILLSSPNACVYITAEDTRNNFVNYAGFEYWCPKDGPSSKSLWITLMFKYSAPYIKLVAENTTEEIYAFVPFGGALFFLGRLIKNDYKSYVQKTFNQFMTTLGGKYGTGTR